MCSTGLMVRLRRWWITRRCASADGEKDENISRVGRGCHVQVWLVVCSPKDTLPFVRTLQLFKKCSIAGSSPLHKEMRCDELLSLASLPIRAP